MNTSVPVNVTINNSTVSAQQTQSPPSLGTTNTGYTPMLLTTDTNGFSTISAFPVMTPGFQMPIIGSNGMPIGCPVFFHTPSSSPLAMMPSGSPLPMMPSGSPLRMAPSTSPLSPLPMVAQTPLAGCGPFPVYASPNFHHNTSNSSMNSNYLPVDFASGYSDYMPSLSREREILGDIQPFESERAQEFEDLCEPLKAVSNKKQVAIPTLAPEFTKKDLVNATLDWFYEVLGSEHFDCEGRRGKNVLRIKVKTRGALEYICVFINQCLEEGLLHHVSCPISTKKQRKQIRGYLAYVEGVSAQASSRIIEIFNEMNTVFVKNCDGYMEHPFKGISQNPIAVRTHVRAPATTHHIAA